MQRAKGARAGGAAPPPRRGRRQAPRARAAAPPPRRSCAPGRFQSGKMKTSPASTSAGRRSRWARTSGTRPACAPRSACGPRRGRRSSPPPPPSLPPSRTDWTRLVPPRVLIGHVSSLLPCRPSGVCWFLVPTSDRAWAKTLVLGLAAEGARTSIGRGDQVYPAGRSTPVIHPRRVDSLERFS